jgi:hypothetical protein
VDVAFCTREQVEKPVDAFSPSQLRKGRGWCRECFNDHRHARGRKPNRLYDACQGPGCTIDLEGRRAHAKFCSVQCSAKHWRAAHPGHQRAYWIKCMYGITQEQFDEILETQGGVCAICKQVPEEIDGNGWSQWNVDHNHVTGVVRGILCAPCNSGIGLLGDTYERVAAAATYLLRAEAQ